MKERTKKITIATDFSPVPAGRSKERGQYSGDRFRDEVLVPAMLDQTIDLIEIDLDGLLVTPPSFFEEAFGGLVRHSSEYGIDVNLIKTKLVILECNDNDGLEKIVSQFIENALRKVA